MPSLRSRAVVPLIATAAAFLAVGGGLVVAELGEADRPPAFEEGGQGFGPEALHDPSPDAATPRSATPPTSASPTPSREEAAGASPTDTVDATGPTPDPEGRAGAAAAGTPTETGAPHGATPDASGTTSELAAPDTGSYRYDLDGWESTSAPGSRREFPGSADVVVHGRQDGADGTSVTVDLTYSGDHEERLVLRYTDEQVAVTFEGGKVSFFGGGVTETSQTSYRPPVIRTVWPASAGHSWNGTAEAHDRDGSVVRRETYTGRVRGTETIAVAGRTLETLVVEWESRFSGSENGWREQTLWFSHELGLWVKVHDRVHAERSGFSYDKDATLTLRRTPG